MKKPQKLHYMSFLLRIWQDDPTSGWRATLEETQTGQRHGFTKLEDLFAFLNANTSTDSHEEERGHFNDI
jgi:hypothetical protein